jgi:hypothetical protein
VRTLMPAPWSAETELQRRSPVHQRQTSSALLVAPLQLRFGTFRQTDTAHAQERGASAPRGSR